MTCVQAALTGAPGIAVGNIVGSNIANILLILGAAALMRPFVTSRQSVLRDGSIVVATALAFAAVAFTGMIGRGGGRRVRRRAGRLHHLHDPLRPDRRGDARRRAGRARNRRFALALLFLAVGLVLVIVGADYLVAGATELARRAAVPEEVIGLTLVAVGTSLPELATSIVAALRGQSAMALGNVLGSNTYNTIGIGGVTALVQPVPVSAGMSTVDVPIMVAVSVLLVVVVATGQRVTRLEGGVLLALYAGYIAFQATVSA